MANIPLWQVKDFMNDPSYHEHMSKKGAEKKLKEQGGSVKCYLTRYSDTSKAHKLSVMHGRGKNQFEHFEISRAKYALIDNDMCFKTLSEMLEYYRKHRISNTLRNIGVPVVYSKYTASKDVSSRDHNSSNGGVGGDGVKVTKSTFGGNARTAEPPTDDGTNNRSTKKGDTTEHRDESSGDHIEPKRRATWIDQSYNENSRPQYQFNQSLQAQTLPRLPSGQPLHAGHASRGKSSVTQAQSASLTQTRTTTTRNSETDGSQKRFSKLMNYYEESSTGNDIGSPKFSKNYIQQGECSHQKPRSYSVSSYSPGAGSQDRPPLKVTIDKQPSGQLPPSETNCPCPNNYFQDDGPSPSKFTPNSMADSKSNTEQKPRSKSESYSPGAGGMDTSPINLPKPMIAKQHSRPPLPPKRSAPPIPPRRKLPSGPKTNIPSAHPETNQQKSTSAGDTSFAEKPLESSIKDTPSLVKFICFQMEDSKVNVAEKIGVKCHDFGVLLLNDEGGDVITFIEREQRGNAYGINVEVFKMWLKGTGKQPVTWDTLVDVLRDIGLNKLANDILIV